MGELGGVAVEEAAVFFGVVFSRLLVFGEVPAGGELGLQSLEAKQETNRFSLIVSTFSCVPSNQRVLHLPRLSSGGH